MPFQFVDVEKLYEKDQKLKRDDARILQEWLKKQQHLPEMKELQIVCFIHSCYYRIEAAKTTIDNYFTMRTQHPEMFATLSEEALRRTLSVASITILPKRTPQGYVVLLMKLTDYKAENFNFLESLSTLNMVTTLYMHQHGFERGALAVFDSKGFTLSHLTKFNLSALKHAIDHVEEAAPVRIKSIHFINVVSILDKVMSIIKPMIKSEYHNLLQLHASMESFHKVVGKECLPEDYGGDLPSCRVLEERNLKNLLNNYEFFKWHESQKVDETKRLGQSKRAGFGVDGTFKKLELD